MRIMAGRTLLLGKNIMPVKIRRGSFQKGLLSHNVAVGAKAGGDRADASLMPAAVAEVALISRFHIDAPLILHKGLMQCQRLCQLDRLGAFLAQQRMAGMADSLLIGSEKLRVFGSMAFMAEIAVFQHRPVMHNSITDQLCFMAALPEAQAQRRGLFPLLHRDVMAGLAFIHCPGFVGAQYIRGSPHDIAHRGKFLNGKAVLKLPVAGKAQVCSSREAQKGRLTGAQRVNTFFNYTLCMRVMAGNAMNAGIA